MSRQLTITHIFFVDDSVIFFQVDEKRARAIKEVLMIYEETSR